MHRLHFSCSVPVRPRIRAFVFHKLIHKMRKNRSFNTTCWILLLSASTGHVASYCFMGGDPGFSGGPEVEYVGDAYVKVSWWGLVTNKKCADQFLVKYWPCGSPSSEKFTDFQSTSKQTAVIKMSSRGCYAFQVVAREDKGSLRSPDWNYSPVTQLFVTGRL